MAPCFSSDTMGCACFWTALACTPQRGQHRAASDSTCVFAWSEDMGGGCEMMKKHFNKTLVAKTLDTASVSE